MNIFSRSIILVSLFSIAMPNSSRTQDSLLVNLKKTEVRFPHKQTHFEIVIARNLTRKDSLKTSHIFPSWNRDTAIYKFGFTSILPPDASTRHLLGRYLTEHNLSITDADELNKAYLVIDENGNRDFTDDKIDTVKLGSPYYREVNLLLDTLSNLYYSGSFEILVEQSFGGISISLKNLTSYELNISIEDTTLSLNILNSFFYVNFKHSDINLRNGNFETQNFRLNEPFYFNGKLRVLSDFDLIKETIVFRTLAQGELPYGYRTGYYINMDKLKEFTNSQLAPECSIAWEKPQYFLLHFWGHWCQPCMMEIEEVKKLSESLKRVSKIEMIHYPLIFSEKDTMQLKEVIASKKLPCAQVVQGLKTNCKNQRDAPGTGGCSVRELVSNDTYPNYILLNDKGKILYRGTNEKRELNTMLAELRILKRN